ncbi:MAG: hypothetical protein AAFQ65_14905 [Myxococcota bacterium]
MRSRARILLILSADATTATFANALRDAGHDVIDRPPEDHPASERSVDAVIVDMNDPALKGQHVVDTLSLSDPRIAVIRTVPKRSRPRTTRGSRAELAWPPGDRFDIGDALDLVERVLGASRRRRATGDSMLRIRAVLQSPSRWYTPAGSEDETDPQELE